MHSSAPRARLVSRRTHKKSRLGCQNCKIRRIKIQTMLACLQLLCCVRPGNRARRSVLTSDSVQCDETKPACTQCLNHDVDCSYSTEDSIRPPSPRKFRFRFTQNSSGALKSNERLPRRGSSQSIGTQCDVSTSTTLEGTISLDDLQLFHHFVVSTVETIQEDGLGVEIWRNHVARWAITCPFIRHLLLALSALHRGHGDPSLHEQYEQQADEHFTFGVRSVTAVLSQLDADSCQRVYIAAILICFVYFGRGPRAGEYLIFSDHGPAEWRVLMNGVKMILQAYQDKVFSGILEPRKNSMDEQTTMSPAMRTMWEEHRDQVQSIQQLIESRVLGADEQVLYGSVVQDLLRILEKVYETQSTPKPGVSLMQYLVGWLYRLPAQLVTRLESKEPVSLVILAHWVPVLKDMESVWFMEGWAGHVLAGVWASVEEQFHPWMEWPRRAVQQRQ